MIKSHAYYRHQFWINLVMILVTISMIMPLVLLLMSSLTSEEALIRNGYSFIPEAFSLDAYRYIMLNRSTVFRAYAITIILTILGTVLSVVLSSTAAYALADRKLPFRGAISFFFVFTMLFNGGLVPSYIMWTQTFHIKNTFAALLIPNLMLSPMNIILIRTFMTTNVPEAIYEAAEIDGAGKIRNYIDIALPLSKPILVTTGLFSALAYWNDWTNALYYVNDSKLFSIQALLNRMLQDIQAIQSNSTSMSAGTAMAIPQVSIRMAIAFVAMLPLLLIYPFLQKYFAQGIALGAVKG